MAFVNQQSKKKGKESKENNKVRFKWDSNMVGMLLEALSDYKCKMEYNNSDFNADKTKQYEAVRAVMAERFFDVEVTFFGPKDLDSVDENDRESSLKIIDEQKKQIQKGYGRVMEKIKELRQGFSHAVVTGTRSGSGKLVMEYYDVMVQIWGGSPATEPLPFGVQSSQAENHNLLDESLSTSVEESIDTNVLSLDNSDEELTLGNERSDLGSGVVPNESIVPNRKRPLNQVPKLIDDKRKKMERQLSAAQRDRLFLQDEKEEKEFRRDLCRSIQESNAVFAESLKAMSSSMAILASTLQQNVQQPTMPMDPRTPTQLSGQQYIPTVFQHGNYIENQEMRVRCPASEQYTLSTDGRTYHKM